MTQAGPYRSDWPTTEPEALERVAQLILAEFDPRLSQAVVDFLIHRARRLRRELPQKPWPYQLGRMPQNFQD
jgi:hypothetical protein